MVISSHFTSIRKEILTNIGLAKSHISIAVCWFTNEDLMNALIDRLKYGVKIDLIIVDDYINCNPFALNFSQFIELGGGLYLSSVDKLMHNKYCIIDDTILINGSYNWTYFAEMKNSENIMVIKDNVNLIQAYNANFKSLKLINKQVSTFKTKPLLTADNASNEDRSRNAFSVFNILSNDLFIKSIETNNRDFYDAAKSIAPDNVDIQIKGTELKWELPLKISSTLALKSVNDGVGVAFLKGTSIPCQATIHLATISDNQERMVITLLIGESTSAKNNKTIRFFELKGIPKLKAREAIIKIHLKITANGTLYITSYIHDTGMVDNRIFDIKHEDFNLLTN